MKTTFVIAIWGILSFPDTVRAQAGPTAADLKTTQICLDRKDAHLGNKCIGIVADPCIEAAAGDGAKARACAARELAVWDTQMENALRKVGAGGFREVIGAVAQSQKAWQSSDRELCSMFDKTDPGMLLGAANYCRMHETASRVLLLRRLGEAVNQH
jgi:hypothetical protein